MKIGLLGAGTIGFGVYEIAEKIPDLEITKVLDRRDIPQLRGKLTQDAAEILDDPAIDAVVELLGGVEPAHSWAVRALEAGKAVVTANKLMLSENLTEMAALSRKTGGKLRFSAAVGGGIPFLFNLLRARRVDEILEVGGILNGTTNYMLDMMQRENLGFEQALKLAQQAGYAEQDPTADVSGGDAKCKIHLSAALAWNGMPDKHNILCEGITSITKQDMEALSKKGYACKLLARAARQEGGISCYVEPTAVPARSVTGNIALVENMAFWRGANAGLQRFTGAGAGGLAELESQVKDYAAGKELKIAQFKHQIAFNLIPQIGTDSGNGYTTEEMKMQNEGRKILHLPEMKVTCTCVRVPVMRSHSISVSLETQRKISVEEARSAIAAAPGCRLVDDLAHDVYPMPLDTSNQDTVFVGRIRDDLVFEDGLALWCCGDQIRKGAATNTVQIAELLL